MQHNFAPASVLFAKVVVKLQPYSQNPISIRVTAAMFPEFSANKALYFTELPLYVTTIQQVYAAVAKLQQNANAANSRVKIHSKVFKFVAE